MPTELVIVGCVAAVLTVVTYFQGYRRSARRYDIIREVPTIAAKDLPGLGSSMVEVKGTVRADVPATSDLARVRCVAFESRVVEHWETRHTERDSKGRTRTVTKHHSRTRYSNEGRIPFEVHDETGRAIVQPEGAVIDMLDGMDLVGISTPLPESPAYDITPRHFGGRLRYHELVLPIEQWVYVLGMVDDDHAIAAPVGVDRPFVISYRSEDALLSRAMWGKWVYGTLAIVLFLVTFAIFGMVLGIIEAPNMSSNGPVWR